MKARRPLDLYAATLVVLLATVALFLQLFGGAAPDAPRILPRDPVEILAAFCKLASFAFGSYYAARAAEALGKDNAARAPWRLFAGWLAAWGVGQAFLSWYKLVLRVEAPLPSVGDAFFLVGYVLLIVGAIRFTRVYLASGLPVGEGYGRAAVVIGLAFVVVAYFVLAPIATSSDPLPARLISCAYPLLDFVALVPTLLLLRITRQFRPGRVWTVWAALLAGIVFAALGDIAFAYFAEVKDERLWNLVSWSLLVSYFLAAVGARLQRDLATE